MRPDSNKTIDRIRWVDVAEDYWGISFIPYTEDYKDVPELQWYNTLEAPQLIVWYAPEGTLTVNLIADATKEPLYTANFKGGRNRKKTRKRKKNKNKIKKVTFKK